MPLKPLHRAARWHRKNTLHITSDGITSIKPRKEFYPEEFYVVEAGDAEGLKYRRIIDYGYDFQFQCNHEEAKDTFNKVVANEPLPQFAGSAVRGKFGRKRMFTPTWAQVLRQGEKIYVWTKPIGDSK
jgi:hypothetical protein